MYTPLTKPVAELALPETKINYPVIAFFHSIIQPYARAFRFKEPIMFHGERMIDTYHAFLEKKIRLIVGFRHAYGDDPHIMSYVFHHVLPKEARRAGKPFREITHVHFMYGAEVPLWSSAFVRWLLPNVGAVPINHIHMDSRGMNRIRKILTDGKYPLAMAPEGHVTYLSEKVGELETGTARFGFWCMEDLTRQGRDEQVVFLPVSHHYRYGKNAGRSLSRYLLGMEKECGIALTAGSAGIRERLLLIGQAILSSLNRYYSELGLMEGENSQQAVLGAMLAAAERIFSLEAEGSTTERIYRIRTKAWDHIYRGDISSMSSLYRKLAGRETAEAWYAMRHIESAEILEYIDLTAIPENAKIENYMEIAHNFYDLIERLKGGTLRNRSNEIDKYAIIVPGEPIVLNEYQELYKTDKKSALQKVTDEITLRFTKCIEEYHRGMD